MVVKRAVITSMLGLWVFWTVPVEAAPPLWGADDGFKPFDAIQAIQQHFREHLPMTWFINAPQKIDTGYSVKVTLAADWGGNPVSAVRNLCPGPDDVLWRHIGQLTLTPFYQKHAWASVECR